MDSFVLDIRTMALMAALAAVLQAAALFVLWRTAPRTSGTLFWAIGGAMLAVGMLLISFRHMIPDFLSVVVANLSVVAAHVAFLLGIERHLGRRAGHLVGGAILAATLLLFLVFTYGVPDVSVRIIVISAALALLSALCVARFLAARAEPRAAVEWLVLSLFAAHALFHVLRGLYTFLVDRGIEDFMQASIVHGAAFVDVVVFSFVAGIGFSLMTVLMVNRQLQAELESRSTLLSIIAHDVRTPFSGLVSLVSLVSHAFKSGQLDSVRTLTEQLAESASEVLTLLEDLVLWGQYEFTGGASQATPFSVEELVDEALAPYRAQVVAKNLALHRRVEAASLSASYPHAKMVLRNLLSNAVKFSPPGGVLSIEGAGVEGAYELRITDQGKGFGAAGAHEIVLGEGAGGDFARKEGTTVGESGLGVGLSLCARICAREGHRVVLQNHPRGGATSRFAIKDRPTEADTA